MEEQSNDKKLLLAVAVNDETGNYFVDIAQGSSVPETAFAMSVVIRCLMRDGYIKDANEIINLVKKYSTDSQFEEVKDDKIS